VERGPGGGRQVDGDGAPEDELRRGGDHEGGEDEAVVGADVEGEVVERLGDDQREGDQGGK
jgi:hypothetical protein